MTPWQHSTAQCTASCVRLVFSARRSAKPKCCPRSSNARTRPRRTQEHQAKAGVFASNQTAIWWPVLCRLLPCNVCVPARTMSQSTTTRAHRARLTCLCLRNLCCGCRDRRRAHACLAFTPRQQYYKTTREQQSAWFALPASTAPPDRPTMARCHAPSALLAPPLARAASEGVCSALFQVSRHRAAATTALHTAKTALAVQTAPALRAKGPSSMPRRYRGAW